MTLKQTSGGKAGHIVADPAWQWEAWGEGGDGRSPKYKRMLLDAICSLPVGDLAAKDCALHVWGISGMPEEAIEVGKAWGFRLVRINYVWVKMTNDGKKVRMGMGHCSRTCTEQCWLFKKGHPRRMSKSEPEALLLPIGEHSRKPEEFQDSMERLYPGPFVELFATRVRPGWTCLGNKIDGRDLRDSIPALARAMDVVERTRAMERFIRGERTRRRRATFSLQVPKINP